MNSAISLLKGVLMVALVGGALAGFSATTCASLGDAARGAYVDRCETFVKTVFTAWRYNPPPECY